MDASAIQVQASSPPGWLQFGAETGVNQQAAVLLEHQSLTPQLTLPKHRACDSIDDSAR
jgi:hypothetical protein